MSPAQRSALTARLASRDLIFTVAVTLVALGLRCLFILRVPLAPAWDGVLYERGARAIAHGLGYTTFMFEHRSSDTVPTAFYPVGYPAFLAALYAIFGAHALVYRLAGAVVSALTVGVAHRLAWRFAPRVPARVSAVALALMPGQIAFASASMTEPLVGLLLTAVVYVFARRNAAPSPRTLVLAGALIAAATYVRPQAIALAILVPLLAPRGNAANLRARLRAAVLTLAIALLCVAPWTARNCARLDGCAFVSTNGGSNFAIGAVLRGNGRYLALGPGDGCAGVAGEVARDHCWRSVAFGAIRSAPWRWVKLAAVKLDHTLSYETFPLSYVLEAQRQSGSSGAPDASDPSRLRLARALLSAPWRVLAFLALLGLAPYYARRSLPLVARGTVVAVIAVVATHVVFFGGDRYHLPVVPLVSVLAAGAFRDLPRVRRARERYRLRARARPATESTATSSLGA